MENVDSTDSTVLTIIIAAAICLVAFLFWRRSRKATVVSYKAIQKPSGGTKGADASDVDDGRPKILFLVGSQTGTAEEYARRLAKDAGRFGFRTKVVEMNDCDRDELSNEKFIFAVASTYGEGDPPDNAQDFYQWISDESLSENLLSGVKFTVFSLGNKTYQHYQSVGRRLDRRFEAVGAHRLYERGEGDDDGSLEDDYLQWQGRMWPVVCEAFDLEYKADGGSDAAVAERRCRLVLHGADAPAPVRETLPTYTGVPDAKNPHRARIAASAELTRTGERSCRHVEFDISGSKISYQVGDHLGVYPENDTRMVARLAARLGVSEDTMFSLLPLQASSAQQKLPVPCSVREALTSYLDFAAPPRKAVLRALADYASDAGERAALIKLSENTPESRVLYEQQICGKDNSPYVSVLGVLEKYPSVKPDLGHFLELLPNLGVRYYSISSSMKSDPSTVHVTCVVTGVCTAYLQRLGLHPDQTATVRIFVRPSTFKLPSNPATPIIMIGPGTGLAPFRGFLQERQTIKRGGVSLGESILFFGCRNPEQDYLYETELKGFLSTGVLSQLYVAFSRFHQKKVYVQHLMLENSATLWSLITDKQAHVYVCGDAKAMAKDVSAALHTIVRTHGNMDEAAAVRFVNGLSEAHRLHQDVW